MNKGTEKLRRSAAYASRMADIRRARGDSRTRDKLAADVKAFEKAGGEVQKVAFGILTSRTF